MAKNPGKQIGLIGPKRKCSVDDCPRSSYCTGLCQMHYKLASPSYGLETCSKPECGKPRYAKGLCHTCYTAQSRVDPVTRAKRNKLDREGANRRYHASQTERDRCRNQQLKRHYGIDRAQYTRMLDDQRGTCAICVAVMDRPFIDHSHTTGAIRALLCMSCNTGLGHFRDSQHLLREALRYLEEHDDQAEGEAAQ